MYEKSIAQSAKIVLQLPYIAQNKVFRPNVSLRLAFVNGLGCFSLGKTLTCGLQKKSVIHLTTFLRHSFPTYSVSTCTHPTESVQSNLKNLSWNFKISTHLAHVHVCAIHDNVPLKDLSHGNVNELF